MPVFETSLVIDTGNWFKLTSGFVLSLGVFIRPCLDLNLRTHEQGASTSPRVISES